MVISNGYLTIFALAMMGCVLATPLVTRIASWVGAIDRPDQFRRIHVGAIPRLGGLGLALGIAAGTILPHFSGSSRLISLSLPDLHHEWVILSAALIILLVGFVDDTRSPGPAGQATGAGGGRPDPLPRRNPDPDHRCARRQPRPELSQRSSSACWGCPSVWGCPAWR